MNYRIKAKVARVEHRFQTQKTWIEGNQTFSEKIDLGWFVVFDGSWEALGLGMEEPQLKVGQAVDIVLVPRD